MMHRGLNSSQSQNTNRKLQAQQSGYMLITLMLMVAVAAMALFAVLPSIKQQIQRDQEEEMCHRATQYMRAIQHFYKKFGRYPTRVEELENTNNLRFLRKRYKDPLTRDQQGKEKDFKLLHMQDINLTGGASLGSIPGLSGAGNPLGNASGNPLGNTGAGGFEGIGQLQNAQQQASPAASSDKDDEQDSSSSANSQQGNSTSGFGSGSGSGSGSPGGSPGFNTGGTTGNGLSGTVFGGGPILGVASTSKATTVREYNKKNHYNDWIFIYDPTSDRGGLLVGPWQIPNTTTLQGATPVGQMPGAQQSPGSSSPFGGSSFGGSSFGGSSFGGQAGPQPQQPPQTPQNQDTPNQQ
jgi:type II secretory pathway pseudopilin PulG